MAFPIYYTLCARLAMKVKNVPFLWLASIHSPISQTVQIAFVCISYISTYRLSLKNKQSLWPKWKENPWTSYLLAKLYTFQRLSSTFDTMVLKPSALFKTYNISFLSNDLKTWTLGDYGGAYKPP